MTIYRIPFLWERMQVVAGGPLDPYNLQQLTTLVEYVTNSSRYSFFSFFRCYFSCNLFLYSFSFRYALIDPHNYGRGWNGIIGQ